MFNPSCGFYAFISTKINAWHLLRKCTKAGIAFVPGDKFYVSDGRLNTARLSIGSIRIDLIRDGIKTLSNIIRTMSTNIT